MAFRVVAPSVRSLQAPAAPRILLVDDDPTVLQALTRILLRNRYLVREATNGRDALESLSNQWFDAVVADVRMHPVDGFEILQRAREFDASLPVILMSGYPDPDASTRAHDAGAFRYLTKPIPLRNLLETAAAAVELRRARHRANSSSRDGA